MDNLVLQHIVQKKIDETGNISHWFLIKDRPTKRVKVFIGFKFSDGREGHIAEMDFPKITYKQRVGNKKYGKESNDKSFGVFEVKVPNGKDPESIYFYFQRFLGQKSELTEVKVTDNYQDIVAEDAIYSAIFNKYL